jgi:3'(2'), 5'-bisphosphate nucleotidase
MRIPTAYHPIEYIWDHAAGSIVASEAGAVVTDLRGQPLDFSQGTRLERNHGILCARPGLHERVLGAIRKLGIA